MPHRWGHKRGPRSVRDSQALSPKALSEKEIDVETTVDQALDAINARLDIIEQRLAPRPLTSEDVLRERSRLVHQSRGEAWPCIQCWPQDHA